VLGDRGRERGVNAKVPEPDPSEDAKGGSGTNERNATMRPDQVGQADD
jgi:hypothetical protein